MNGNKCRICRGETQGRFKLCEICLEGIHNYIMKYFNFHKLHPNDLFKEIYKGFSKPLKNDLGELYDCIKNELYNASNLLAFRILEYNLKFFMRYDMDFNEPRDIRLCINKMKEMNFNQQVIDLLDDLRQLRNETMHTSKQFESDETINNIKKIFTIILWIHNSY